MENASESWKVPCHCVYLIEGQLRKQISLRLLRNAIYLGALLRRYSAGDTAALYRLNLVVFNQNIQFDLLRW